MKKPHVPKPKAPKPPRKIRIKDAHAAAILELMNEYKGRTFTQEVVDEIDGKVRGYVLKQVIARKMPRVGVQVVPMKVNEENDQHLQVSFYWLK